MKYLLILLSVFLASCNSQSSPENDSGLTGGAAVESDSSHSATVTVTIDGKVLGFNGIDPGGSKTKITPDAISLALTQKDNPLKLDLEVMDTGILAKGSASYVLPLAKKDGKTVDLSLIDSTRPGLAMKQRVLFTEGSIDIKEVTEHSVQVAFKGSGHALMDQKKFPIEGSVNITF
jgi:hypothetical protein